MPTGQAITFLNPTACDKCGTFKRYQKSKKCVECKHILNRTSISNAMQNKNQGGIVEDYKPGVKANIAEKMRGVNYGLEITTTNDNGEPHASDKSGTRQLQINKWTEGGSANP